LLAGVVDGDDVGMIQDPGGAGFEAKAAQYFVVVGPFQINTHGLERNHAADGRVFGAIHHAHGASPQFIEDAIPTDLLSWQAAGHAATETPAHSADIQRAVRAVLDEQVAAWNRGDVEGYMLGY